MMNHLSRLFTLCFFLAAPLSVALGFTPDTTRQNSPAAKPLNDSVVALVADTSYYLTLPLVVRQDSVPIVPNELVQDRLSCLQNTIPLHYNSYVQAYVNYFTIRNRRYTRRILERENVYFPLFEKYLALHGLPQEFKYLAVVESALNPRAVSWAKAVGLWQFMSPTAGDFRLQITPFIDERMDPEKSTEAACKFIKQLYRIFGDWELVMAAYNCGPGNVRKAIARAGGGKKTFWEIFPYLPQETRGYVPTFTAIVYAMNHAQDHEIVPDTLRYPIATDTVLISQSLDLSRLAFQLSLNADELQQLNPAIRKGVLPETIKNYPLKVPAQSRQMLAMNRAAILDSSRVPVIRPVVKPEIMLAAEPQKKAAPALPADSTQADSLQQTEYVVVKGDFLEKIARKNQVSIAQIREWNNLSSSALMPGQKLVIYTAAQTAEASAEEIAEEKAPETKATQNLAAQPQRRNRSAQPMEEVKLIHAVQPGDTLYNISRRYNNIPVERIKKLNKLKSDEIKPGQKLVIS